MVDQSEFNERVRAILANGNRPPWANHHWSTQDSVELLRKYFAGTYTGGSFERFGNQTNRDSKRFTAEDVVAVSMLGVHVPARAALALLDGGTLSAQVSELLNELPVDKDMWDVGIETFTDRDGAAWRLWECVNGLHGVGWVTTNKLLARKRPRLIPVYDSVVQKALLPGRTRFWERLWTCLHENPSIVTDLRDLRTEAGELDDIALLRILDIVIWMRLHGDNQIG